jgi:DNA segregation ATPase FtsK/SpoIIIE, S-DNA-T family
VTVTASTPGSATPPRGAEAGPGDGRGLRPEPPALPSGRVTLKPPPRLRPSEGASGVALTAIPMLGSVGAIVLVATITRGSGAGSAAGTRSLLAGGMFLLATIGFVVLQVDRQRRQRAEQVTGSRTEYLRHLAAVRASAREAAAQQRRALTWHHPAPAALPPLAEERSRVWERGPTDARFLHVRFGTGAQPLAVDLVAPDPTTEDAADPACVSALHRLLQVHRTQPDLPLTLDLRSVDRVELVGRDEDVRALARALVCSATAFHSPDQVVLAVYASPDRLAHWDWVKWLPHALSRHRSDAVGPVRLVATSWPDLAAALPPELADRPRFGGDERPVLPHVVLVTDGVPLPPDNHLVPPDGVHGVTVLDLPGRATEIDDPSGLRLQLTGPAVDHDPSGGPTADVEVVRLRHVPVRARADLCDLATAEAFARRLTPLHSTAVVSGRSPDAAPGEIAGPTDFMDLLGLGDVHDLEPEAAWRTRPARDRLRVPVGLGERGGAVHLDLKESAQQGMGPHGLVIGATGSGKSEFLRTLVLGLALTHPPDQLNLVLVDFKGGATFAGLSRVPHVSAVITNLADDLGLVDRMQDALSGEMVRRQELLRSAGGFASVRDYERARAAGERLAPLPSLLIVVDEFSELLSAKPELLDLFVAIGRLGRSLGLHLLLASQRLEEGRLRGLESHLSYRVGLRTFSAQESRAVLGVPDAYELPAVPGLGLLKPDPTTLSRFKSAYVSAPALTGRPAPLDESGHVRGILPFTVSEVVGVGSDGADGGAASDARRAPESAGSAQDSLLEVAVARLEGHGTPAHRVWLPPLDRPDTLDALAPDLVADPTLGLVSPGWRALGGLRVPLGTVDRPREQRRDTLTVDLAGAGGHVAVVGGPRSGKSTLLRTLVSALSLTTTPRESQFYVLDFGGGTFAGLAGLPHVAGVATRGEPDVVRRVVAELQGILDRREDHFRTHGIDSVETYRARRAQGLTDDGYGDVFLVVDGWSTLRADFDELEPAVQALAGRGLTFGVHVLAGASRWADFRAAVRDVFGTRLELRLGDPLDSEVDRKVAGLVPAGRPGRGLLPGGVHFLGALPRVDGSATAESLGAGVDDLVARSRAAWPGPDGPKLRLLPERITLDRVLDISGPPPGSRRLHLGLDEKQLAPVSVDPDTEPHLLLLGDGGSGKSAFLRAHCREVVRTRTPAEAQLVVVDYRRSLLGEVPEEYLLNYLTSAAQAQPAIKELATYLESRLPGPDVTPEQLRSRTWWTGAEVFVVVDDYDLVATAQTSPVALLQPLLAQARDVGLHLVVARRSGGASRALYEPVVQGIRDLAMPQLLLSGSPDEGPLVGNLRPTPLPPGRGRLVTRERGVETIQTAWTEPVV